MEFADKGNKVHNFFYDYSLVDYINRTTKVKIICPKHGVFEQTPNSHLAKKGCKLCDIKTNEDFINDGNKEHNFYYDYSLSDYKNAKTKVKIICPRHGVFEQTPDSHIRGGGCPICNESKGERGINSYLIDNNFKFIRQHKFIGCRDKGMLSFDFYLPDYNICIEFNGIQHYEPVKRFGGEAAFKIQQRRDKIKLDYCLKNNIELIVIKYTENIIHVLSANPILKIS